MQRFLKPVKKDNFELKKNDIFLIFDENINCGYMLELPHPSLDLLWHFVVFHGICKIFYGFHGKSANLP